MANFGMHSMEGRNVWKQDQGSTVEAPGESWRIDFLSSDCGFQTGAQDVVEPKKEERGSLSLALIELLKSHGNRFKRLNGERLHVSRRESISMKEPTGRMSHEDIMQITGQRFIQSSSHKIDIMPMLSTPCNLSLSGLSSEEIKDIELFDILLASAEKVSNQEYECAIKLLSQCDRLSSSNGNAVQRVVYYFSEALREKLDRKSKGSGKKLPFDIPEVVMTPNSAALAHFKDIPFCQVAQFAGVQAIVENVGGAKRIHIIDLGIKSGVQWALLMQALVSRNECLLESLKVTAVGPFSRQMEGAGKWLMSFAETMNLPFSFTMVTMSDMFDVIEDQFEIDAEETVAVYSELFMWTMIPQPHGLDSLMKMIRKLNPCIMVIIEVDSNFNSPDFVSRFIETLFFYIAYFDCLDVCMEKDDQSRLFTESLLSQGIKSVVVDEGDKRKIQHVKIDVWRAFLSRFGMEEKDLSMPSVYQAYLMVKNFACGNSCTLDMNGKSLIIGWKGTSIHSLSVWEFL